MKILNHKKLAILGLSSLIVLALFIVFLIRPLGNYLFMSVGLPGWATACIISPCLFAWVFLNAILCDKIARKCFIYTPNDLD